MKRPPGMLPFADSSCYIEVLTLKIADPHRRKLRLGIATDEPMSCAGIQTVFREQSEIRVVWLPTAEELLVQSLALLEIDVVLLDFASGFPDDIEPRLRRHGVITPLILWKRYEGEAGECVVLDKRASPIMMLACVESVLAGKNWSYSPANAQPMLSDLVDAPVHVSPREAELINLVAEGLSNREIAQRLKLTEGSVKVYFSRLFQKLGVPDRVGLVLYSMQSPFGGELTRGLAMRRTRKRPV
jgi:two-component system nitrate/nitrite response regulator NarL